MDVTKSRTADPTRIRADVVVIPVADPPGTLAGPLAAVDTALGGLVSAVIKDGEVTEYEIHPEDFGFAMTSTRALRVETPEESRAMLMSVLENQAGPARDIVALNAGVALYAANVSPTMAAGIALADKTIASGAALAKLSQWRTFCDGLKSA